MPNFSLSPDPLKILVFGAGAIGTYIGGSLALAGHHVVFVERPEVAEFIRQNGMRLTLNGSSFVLQPASIAVLPSLEVALASGPFDVALFALKSFDTASLLHSLYPSPHPLPPILCLSNGVDNEPTLAEVLGPEKVIYGTVTTAIGRRAAGDIVVEKLRGTGVAAGHPLSERLADAMNTAGLNTQLFPKAADMKWSKMLTNLLANATSAILDLTPAEIFANPRLCNLEVEQLREALRVMTKLGINVVDLPKTPVRLLALGVRLPPGISRPLLARAVGGGRGAKLPSFHIDLHAGRGQSEVEYLNGAVVRYGQRVGVPTPVNRLLTETLLALTRGEIALDEYAGKPEKLLQGLRERG